MRSRHRRRDICVIVRVLVVDWEDVKGVRCCSLIVVVSVER
jgi:hypothetical protein